MAKAKKSGKKIQEAGKAGGFFGKDNEGLKKGVNKKSKKKSKGK